MRRHLVFRCLAAAAWSGLLLGLATGLTIAACGSAPAFASEGEPLEPRAAVAALLAELQGEGPASPQDVARRLSALGLAAYPALLDALGPAQIGTPQHEALRSVIAARGEKHLRAYVASALAADGGNRNRLELVRLLGKAGGPEVVDLAADVVAGVDPTWLPTKRVQSTWEEALTGMLSPGVAPKACARSLRRVPTALEAPTARALVKLGGHDALTGVVVLLGQGRADAAALLKSLCEAPKAALARVRLEAVVMSHLRRGEGPTRRAAAALAAHAGLQAAFDDLLALLDEEDPRLARAATRALRALTGAVTAARSESWRAWRDAEASWLEASDLAERLEDADPGVLARALSDVVAHRFVAAPYSPAVADLLRHRQARVRRQACVALGALGDVAHADALVTALDDEDEHVRGAALSALTRITGETHPPDRQAWTRALADR